MSEFQRQKGIFICYRRRDSEGFAGRLCRDLRASFGPRQVFMDVNIDGGRDWKSAIGEAVASCGCVLVLIGPSWLDCDPETGEPRLFDEADDVRLEIEAALRAQNVYLIPVLLGGTTMPRADELPAEIATLPNFQGHELSNITWSEQLAGLDVILKKKVPRDWRGWLNTWKRDIGFGAVALVAFLLLVFGLTRLFDEVQNVRQDSETLKGLVAKVQAMSESIVTSQKGMGGLVSTISGDVGQVGRSVRTVHTTIGDINTLMSTIKRDLNSQTCMGAREPMLTEECASEDGTSGCLRAANMRARVSAVQAIQKLGCAEGVSSAFLPGVNLSGADLRLMNLRDANLNHAVLRQASLRGADLTGSNLDGADFEGASMQGAYLSWVQGDDVNFSGADLRRAILAEAVLKGVKAQGADLVEVNLSGAELDGSEFSGADLTGAQLRGIVANGGANWAGSDLTRATLDSAQLKQARMETATFLGSSLEWTDLSAARLDGASFSQLTLKKTILSNANLSEASFTRVDFDLPSLQGAVARRATFDSCTLTAANLAGVDLTGARFSSTDLRWATLRGADFSGSTFDTSDLRELDFDGVKLSSATFKGSDLRGADLRGAVLARTHTRAPRKAMLLGGLLSFGDTDRKTTVVGDAGIMLKRVCWDERTTWPDGVIPPPSVCPRG